VEKDEETSLKVLGHLRIQGVDQRRLVGEVVIERADADPRGPADVLEADRRRPVWDDEREAGVRELRRVARGPVVILTYLPEVSNEM
jgi:hypothetical protein